jgi:hypothetical protein
MEDLGARIDAVEARFIALADVTPTDALTDPDPGGTERWEGAQVWAHTAEFGDYWLDELDLLLTSAGDAPEFGRVKSNPQRIAAIEAGRRFPANQHLHTIRRALDRLREFVAELDDDGWARSGTHETLGVMTMEQMLEEFLIGHYEQHADQLDTLR